MTQETQTTEEGILFADARYNTAGANSDKAGDIADLLASDYVDPDSSILHYIPKECCCPNTRRSGFNVKKYRRNYISTAEDNTRYNDESMAAYKADPWVTESATKQMVLVALDVKHNVKLLYKLPKHW